MSILTKTDEAYWIAKEDEIRALLVDLADLGVVIDRAACRRGWTDDPHCLARPGVAEALARARAALPEGHNFLVADGWRSWPVQQAAAADVENEIREAHRDWPPEQVAEQAWTMAPMARVVPRFGSHRYGGAVDLTVIGPDGRELNMGVPIDHCTGPEAALLWYDLLDRRTPEEDVFRANRWILIRAMAAGGFEPYLPEFWHWNYRNDLYAKP